jgi:hypothetical protein
MEAQGNTTKENTIVDERTTTKTTARETSLRGPRSGENGRKKKDTGQPKQLPAPNSDFYEVTEALNAESFARLKQVREFMAADVAPVINKYRADDVFPFELVPLIRELKRMRLIDNSR